MKTRISRRTSTSPPSVLAEVRMGLGVDLTDNSGKLLEKTKVDFISAQVDSTLQEILVKTPVQATPEVLRNAQMIKARVIWSTRPMAVVPVLAVARQGEQSFVFVVQKMNGMAVAHRTSVTLGDTVGNSYSITSGLNAGDSVIVSGTQFLVDGMPVMPMPGPAPPAPSHGAGGAQSMNSGAKANTGGAHTVAANHPLHKKHRQARAWKNEHTQTARVS